MLLVTWACGAEVSPPSQMVQVPLATGDTLLVDRGPVTVAEYAVFAKAADYVTQAEIYGSGGVFNYEQLVWELVPGANYLQPFGKTPIDQAHPVTQVSYYDAQAYCAYYNKRLPTAAEWEAIAQYKQPTGATAYPWGDSIRKADGSYRANVWQGIFPYEQNFEDGYAYTSPVGAFGAAPNGLVDLAGNVWEWTSDTIAHQRLPGEDVHRVAKGGSFLCEPGWCHGYLISGFTSTSSETALFHTGFRCVCDK